MWLFSLATEKTSPTGTSFESRFVRFITNGFQIQKEIEKFA